MRTRINILLHTYAIKCLDSDHEKKRTKELCFSIERATNMMHLNMVVPDFRAA
jgi:hypothetical protein